MISFRLGCTLSAAMLLALSVAQANEAFYPSSYAARHCASCHVIATPDVERSLYPDLRGLDASYLAEALRAYRSKERSHALMQQRASALDDDQLTALARYFSGIRVERKAPQDKDGLGAEIAIEGLWRKGVPACESCHGAGEMARPFAVPTLHGQPVSYLKSALHAYRNGARVAGSMQRMAAFAGRLSDTEIDAVAAYYAGDLFDDE